MRRVGVVIAEEDVVPTVDEVETAAPKALGSGAESLDYDSSQPCPDTSLSRAWAPLATAIVGKKATVRIVVVRTFARATGQKSQSSGGCEGTEVT